MAGVTELKPATDELIIFHSTNEILIIDDRDDPMGFDARAAAQAGCRYCACDSRARLRLANARPEIRDGWIA